MGGSLKNAAQGGDRRLGDRDPSGARQVEVPEAAFFRGGERPSQTRMLHGTERRSNARDAAGWLLTQQVDLRQINELAGSPVEDGFEA
jgi:hypothetical protein